MVETIRLESGHTLTGIVGSNPTLSATVLPTQTLGTSSKVRVMLLCSRSLARVKRLRDKVLATV